MASARERFFAKLNIDLGTQDPTLPYDNHFRLLQIDESTPDKTVANMVQERKIQVLGFINSGLIHICPNEASEIQRRLPSAAKDLGDLKTLGFHRQRLYEKRLQKVISDEVMHLQSSGMNRTQAEKLLESKIGLFGFSKDDQLRAIRDALDSVGSPWAVAATAPASPINARGRKIVGIDLGMTFSCVAHINDQGRPETLLNDDNQPTTASAVMIEDKNNIVVGQIAKEHSVDSPEKVAILFKKLMGRGLKLDVGGTDFSTEELSAMILKKLKQDAERRLGQTINDAVITVPAWFGADARKATQNAGEMAGFQVHRILDEPVAAALAYGFSDPAKSQTLLVYDLSGSTFDTTLFKIKPPAQGNIPDIEMIAACGNHNLGGSNWDQILVDFVASEFMATYGTEDPRDDRCVAQDLVLRCEKAKINLSRRLRERIVCQHDGKALTVELTAEKMHELTEGLVDETEVMIDNLLADKEYSADMIDKVLLSGGSTRLKSVRTMLEKKFPGRVDFSVEPDLCVAEGAAWLGHMLSRIISLSRINYVPRVKVSRIKAIAEGMQTPRSFENVKAMGNRPITTVPSSDRERFDVFLSAKNEDYSVALTVFDFLKANGVAVFFSGESLSELGNSDYRDQIDQVLDEIRHMVVVTSCREHLMSEWVKAEWGFFINERRSGRKTGNLVTLITNDIEISQLPPSLRGYEVLPFHQKSFEKLLRYLR